MGRLFMIFCFFLSVATNIVSAAPPDLCSFEEDDEDEAIDPAEALGNLAVKLYQLSIVSKPGENIVFSPTSIGLNLALAGIGANGETLSEIHSLLGHVGTKIPLQPFLSLPHRLQLSGKNSEVKMANGLFYSDKLSLRSDYVDKAKGCFEAGVIPEPFSTRAEDARSQINQWVSSATGDKISELSKKDSIDANTVAVLVNAISFNAMWSVNYFPFTENLPFYRSGKTDQAKEVPFIFTYWDLYPYTFTDTYETTEIKYNDAISFVIILPRERDGIAAVEKSLTAEELKEVAGADSDQSVRVKLPRSFTAQFSMDLKDVVTKLGVQQMFSDQATFNLMSADNMKISGAQHQAYLKVGGGGTKPANEAPEYEPSRGPSPPIRPGPRPPPPPPPPPPVTFIADHPFIYSIVHTPTRAILFVGKVDSVDSA